MMKKGHRNTAILLTTFIILISIFNYSSHAQETDTTTIIGVTTNEGVAQPPDEDMEVGDSDSANLESGNEISGFKGQLANFLKAVQLDITLITTAVFVGLLFSTKMVVSKLRPDLDVDPRPRKKRRILIITRPVMRAKLTEFEKIQMHKRFVPSGPAVPVKDNDIEPPKDTRPQIRFICVDGRIRDRMEQGSFHSAL